MTATLCRLVTRLIKNLVTVKKSVCYTYAHAYKIMTNSVLDVSALVQLAPLQFGGGFIEFAILFLILAVIAGILGARGVAGLSLEIAKWLVIIFVILAIISFVL